MNEIPEFQVAISDFRRFLIEQGHVGELVWVFHDDLWFQGIESHAELHAAAMRRPIDSLNPTPR